MSSIVHGIDYEILEEAQLPYIHVRNLGHGHSGNVEEVKDRVTLEVYACKTIRITGSKKERAERTRVFRNEVEIIRGLEKHWHIISVHATYATKRYFSILLQPVASDGDLEEFLAEYRDIAREEEAKGSTSTRVTVMTGILMQAFGCLAAGLAFMHEKRIRHKDIKPRNILVHKDMVIYTDFGYSFDSNGFTRSTSEGRPDFLTRRYSAPEVLSCEKRNSKSDVYSLGCVYMDVASALTGSLSIDADKCFMEIMDQLHAQLWALTTPSLPDCLPILITSMTQLKSAGRICAGHLARNITGRPGLSCRQCMAANQGVLTVIKKENCCTLQMSQTGGSEAGREHMEPPILDPSKRPGHCLHRSLVYMASPVHWEWSDACQDYYCSSWDEHGKSLNLFQLDCGTCEKANSTRQPSVCLGDTTTTNLQHYN
jgi:serine/threonine protein kinase